MIPGVDDFSFVALIVTAVLLVILVYLSSKLITFVSHLSSSGQSKADKREELLQLLLLGELMDSASDLQVSRSRDSAEQDKHSDDRSSNVRK